MTQPPSPSSSSSLQPQQQQQQLSPQDQALAQTIVTDLLNNELAGDGTSSSQLIQIIKQKYPDASSAVIMGVINNLAGQITK